MAGIPTMVLTRQGFTQVVSNAFAGFGFPSDGPVVYEFPMEMFVKGSDLTPLQDNIDKVIAGLTEWTPKITEKGVYDPDMVTVEGEDYRSAQENLNLLFLRNQWRDGFPVLPPTEDQVKRILTGTNLDPSTEISPEGGVVPRGGIATVNSLAVILAMVGGRPEHLPVLIAIVKAITDPRMLMQSWNATTCSVIPAVIINGPIAKQIRLGSGYGMLGPDPLHPAGQILGRAIRLIQQDLGGALPGNGTMAIYGGMRSTNAVFAEDEEGTPEGWTTIAEERGYSRDQNIVTVTEINSMQNCIWDFGTEQTNNECLMKIASQMGATNRNRWSHPDMWKADNPNLCSGLFLCPRGLAQSLVSENNYSKGDVKKFLWDNSFMPWEEVVATGQTEVVLELGLPEGEAAPVTPTPEQVKIMVAGGDQSGHGYWMAAVVQGDMVSTEIELPPNWDDMMKQAEADWGPLPTSH